MNKPALQGYDDKTPNYYENERRELLRFVPPAIKTVLDVGCGAGRFGQLLRETYGCHVWGIEPDPLAADKARTRLNRVSEALFTPDLELEPASFDLICFNDVLEHLALPEHALVQARTLLKPGGHILASVPNFRQFNHLWDLVVHGRASYRTSGIMDRTHLRLFTFDSFVELFAQNHYNVVRLGGINPQFTRRLFWIINALTLGKIADMRWLQIVVLACPSPPACSPEPTTAI